MDHEMTIGGTLFDRVVQILEQARSTVVQSVNTNMVTVILFPAGKATDNFFLPFRIGLSRSLSKRKAISFPLFKKATRRVTNSPRTSLHN